MLTTTAVETSTEYILTVTDGGENIFKYRFGKEQDIQVCKREAELLAQYEIDKRAEPTEVVL